MPSRIFDKKEQYTPGLNFPIKIVMNFSVAEKKINQDNFAIACYDEGQDKSKILRDIFYKSLGIKEEKEFQKFLQGSLREVRKYIYDRMKKVNKKDGEDCFSEIMSEGIVNYINEHDKHKNSDTKK